MIIVTRRFLVTPRFVLFNVPDSKTSTTYVAAQCDGMALVYISSFAVHLIVVL